jgi:ubiquitin carboxyl-terminal hydrolase 14
MTSVVVKWGGKSLDVKCDTSLPVADFMLALEKLTGVPVARQTLAMRRCPLKATDTWKPDQVKPGSIFMLVGTAELAPVVEDVPEEVLADDPAVAAEAEARRIMVGLRNYGNTCYLNACLQTFRFLPDFMTLLLPSRQEATSLAGSFVNFYSHFPAGLERLIVALKLANPALFDAKDQQGAPAQQDSAEVWIWLINFFRSVLGDRIAELFQIRFRVESTIVGTSQPQEETQEDLRLSIYIKEETRRLEDGVEFEGTLERNDANGRPAIWTVKKSIAKLPKYLVCQMVRFYYKSTEKVNAKICRRVEHPFQLDTLAWAAPDLRKHIIEEREAGRNAGRYHLIGVLTHRGRSSEGGHYVAHMKVKDAWLRFDDEKVTEIEDSDIEQLSGSPDWHTSTLVLYEADQ